MARKTTAFKPAYAHTVSPHLICAGAAKAIDFYKDAFGAEEVLRIPAPDGKLMHGCIKVCGSTIMLVDEFPQMGALGPKGLKFSPVTIHLYVEDADAFVARAVKAGAQVTMPVTDMFWGDRYGTLVDPFGHRWSVATHQKDMTEAELREAMAAAMANAKGQDCPEQPADKGAFTISHDLDAPRDLVWKVFTDVDHLEHWWGPKGITIAQATVDLRPGGKFHYCMQTPTGDKMWGRFVYRTITAPESMLYVSSFSDAEGGITRHPMAPDWPREMIARFDFAETGRKTRFTVTWSPLDATPQEQAAFDNGRASMQQGWSGTLDKLTEYLAQIQRKKKAG